MRISPTHQKLTKFTTTHNMRNAEFSASVWQQIRIRLKWKKSLLQYVALMSMVTVEHLHKVFGRFTAVKDATFSIEKGEIVGFLGPNGAGKTTLVKLLCGLLDPTEGKVLLNGKATQRFLNQ